MKISLIGILMLLMMMVVVLWGAIPPARGESPGASHPIASPPIIPAAQPATVSFFGMNTYFTGLERYWTDQEQDYDNPSINTLMALGRAAGVAWGREEISWDNLQYSPGVWDKHVRSRFYDKHLLTMAQSGYGIIGILLTTEKNARVADCEARIAHYNGNPEYLSQGPIWCPPANLQEFQTFVQDIVERYDSDGVEDAAGSPRIAAWQIWNEPNHWETWPGSPEEYGRLLEAAYQGVKAADPTALVMTGGLYVLDGQSAVLGNCACHKDGLVFFKEVLDAYPAAWNAFDVLAIHPYMPFDAPDSPDLLATVTLWGRITTTQNWLIEQTQLRGGAMRPIWISEVGWITDVTALTAADEQRLSRYRIPDAYRRNAKGGGGNGDGGHIEGVSESAQAIYMVRAHAIAQALAIPHLNYLQLEDKFDSYFGDSHLWAGSALLKPKIPASDPAIYPPKPAYEAYRVMTEQLASLQFAGFGGLHTYGYPPAGYNPVARYHLQYAPTDGQQLQIDLLWQSRGSNEMFLPLHPLAVSAEVVSYQGARSSLVPQNGMVAVTVSEYPIYVRQTLASPTPTPTDTVSPTTPTHTPTPTHTSSPTPTVTPTPTLTPTAIPIPDSYEPDDRCQGAPAIAPDGAIHEHTFHVADDTDWSRVDVVSGTTYLIEAVVPPGSVANVALELFSDCSQSRTEQSQAFPFTSDVRIRYTATTTAPIFLSLTNNASSYGKEATYHLAVHTLPRSRADTFVIVEGRGTYGDSEKQQAIARVGPSFRSYLLNQGYTPDWIYFLLPDIYDSPILTRTLESALTTWAARKTGPEQMLTLYMVGEVQDDTFLLNQSASQRVSLSMLNQWLTALEQQRPDIHINIIIDTPGSVWALGQTNILGKPGRVVMIASSATAGGDVANQQVANLPSYDAIYSDYFIAALQQQTSLFHALLFSQYRVSLSMPWYRFQVSDTAGVAAQRGFLFAETAAAPPWPPRITNTSPPIVDQGRAKIQAMVQVAEPERAKIDYVYATIYPPSYAGLWGMNSGIWPTTTITRTTIPTLTLVLKDTENHLYEGEYDGFTDVGFYRVVIQARDSQELFADPVAVTVEVQATKATLHAIYLPMVFR